MGIACKTEYNEGDRPEVISKGQQWNDSKFRPIHLQIVRTLCKNISTNKENTIKSEVNTEALAAIITP